MALSTRLTKQQLIDSIREELLDPNSKYWSDTELGNYVDQWQDRVQEQCELVWGTNTATLTATATATMPSDMLRLDAVYWNGTRLAQRTAEELEAIARDWRDHTNSVPTVVYQESTDGNVAFWPIPTGTGTVVYEYPKILSFGTLTSTHQLPAWTKFSCNNYAIFKAFLRHGPNQDVNKALKYKRMFLEDLVSFTSWKQNVFPAKYLSIRPAGKYEIDILNPRGNLV